MPAGFSGSAGAVEYETMFRFIFKLLRIAVVAALGTAIAAKLLLESNAEPATEEIDLVSIFEGQQLISEAAPFYGGKVMAMFGGVVLDLRKATPAPTGIYLDLAVMFGGVSLVVPEGWRVKFEGNMMAGGFSDQTRTTAEEDVPTVTVTGFVAMGGLQATTKSPVQAAS
jgi:predicted membrane protein